MPEDKIVDGTLYAVVGVIFNKEEEVLMFKREGEEWEHGWEPVKGGIQGGESEEEAVRREIEEEAGLNDIKIIGKLDKYNNASKPWKGGKLDIKSRIFACEYLGGNIELGEPEHVDYRWMDLGEAKEKNWLTEGKKKVIGEAYRLYKNQ